MKKSNNTREIFHKALADFLGLEKDDIQEEDQLSKTLNMEPTKVSDFLQNLDNEGHDTSDIDLEGLLTVEDLLDNLSDINQ